MERITEIATQGRVIANDQLRTTEPIVLVVFTGAFTIFIRRFVLWTSSGTVSDDLKKMVFDLASRIPAVKRLIAAEMASARKAFVDEMSKATGGPDAFVRLELPATGLGSAVLEEVDTIHKLNRSYDSGECSGTVYNDSADLTKMLCQVHEKFHWTNPLHMDIFPGVKKMEAEIISMCLAMFNGTSECVGAVTSGGTESIIMAMKAYRDQGREKGINTPNFVVANSAHCAFDKGGAYLGIRLIKVPVDPATGEADVKSMARAVTRNTLCIVGSAPSFPHGSMDDISALSRVAIKKKIGLHVDSCLGGFLVPFMAEAGYPLPLFDFRVPGVTSISADSHKYGFTPKGSSIIMYRSADLRKHQFFAEANWPGGLYTSPTIAGSRSGATVAGAWAAMVYMGRSGYVESTQKVMHAAKSFEEGLKSIPELGIVGLPQVSVVAFNSVDPAVNVYELTVKMAKKGWHLSNLQFPSAVHVCFTMVHAKPGVVERLLADLKEGISLVREDYEKDPTKKSTEAAIYGSSQSVPDRRLINVILSQLWDVYYTAKM